MDKPATRGDIEKLKLWVDEEISFLHVFNYIILGFLIGGKFWIFAGAMIFISFVYAFKRAAKLPKNYLRVPNNKLK